MTRKDFKLIASVIAELNFTQANKLFIAVRFADELERDSGYNINGNKRFNRDLFIDACVPDYQARKGTQ